MLSLGVAGGVRREVVCQESKQCVLSEVEPEQRLCLAPFVLVNGQNDL